MLLTGVLAFLLAFLLTLSQIQANDNIRILYTQGPHAFHAWLFHGMSQGIYSDNGIDIEIVGNGGGSQKTNLSAALGHVDVSITDFASVVIVNDKFEESKIKTIMVLDAIGGDILITRNKITELSEINGMRLAANPNSTSAKLLRIVTDAKPDYINIPLSLKEISFEREEVEGFTTFKSKSVPHLVTQFGYSLDELNITPLVSRNPWTVGFVLNANSLWVEEHRQVVKRFINASKMSIESCVLHKQLCLWSLQNQVGSRFNLAVEEYRLDYWLKESVYTDMVKELGLNYDRTEDLKIYTKNITEALDMNLRPISDYYEHIE